MIWHLIRKDHRVLGWWLAAWAGVQIIATGLSYAVWRSGATPNLVMVFLWPVLIFGACVVTLLIHQEPVVRGVNFWRTRPLRPKHLLLGKGFSIGLHFVLIPSLFCLVFLLATGYREYLGLVGVEWFWKLLSWLIPVVTIAVFTNSFSRFLGIALAVMVGFGVLSAIHDVIRKDIFEQNVRVGRQFPSRSGVAIGLAMIFGVGLTLRQYLVGGLRGAIKWVVLGVLVMQGLWWLPINRSSSETTRGRSATGAIVDGLVRDLDFVVDPRAKERALPPSNSTLDALVRDLDLVVPPLASEHDGISERDGVEFLQVKRQPSFAVGSRAHDLRIMVDERASRLETTHGTLVSPNPRPISPRQADRADYLATIGAVSTVPRHHGEFGRILEVPLPRVQQLGGATGTLHGEAVAMLRESEVIARLPLRAGAVSRKGPHMINILTVERQIDNGKPEIHIAYSVYYPNRVVTEPWLGVTSNGFEKAWLVHKRLNVALGQGGGGQTSGRLHPLVSHHRFSYGFQVPNQIETLSPVLWKEEFRAEDWELVVVRNHITASKRVPFTVPGFQLSRVFPSSRAALESDLKAVSLPDNASDEGIEEYLWEVWRCWREGSWRRLGETLEAKLSAVGPERLHLLLKVHERLRDDACHNGKIFSRRVIAKLATEDHRELILERLDTIPKLLEVIEARGWEDAAIPRLIEIAQAMPRVPPDWVDFFVRMRERHPQVILAMHDYSEFDEKYFELLREIPGFPLEELVDRILLTSIHQYHFRPPEGLSSALILGRPQALDYARLYLKGAKVNRKLDHAGPLLELLARLTSCVATVEGASVWLEKHARTATFDQATGRYQITP